MEVTELIQWMLLQVTFTRTRYHECVAHRAWQDKVSEYI